MLTNQNEKNFTHDPHWNQTCINNRWKLALQNPRAQGSPSVYLWLAKIGNRSLSFTTQVYLMLVISNQLWAVHFANLKSLAWLLTEL